MKASLHGDADPASPPIDLSGVDPTRWAETRRRVGILREWCAKPRHSHSESVAAAARMGVSVGQFIRLVASWKTHGDAVRISGANRRRGAPLNTSSLPQATRDAINGAIAALGPQAAYTAIRDEAARRCRLAGTPEASDGMVHYLIMRSRRDGGAHAGKSAGRLLVGHVEVLLPVADGDGGAITPHLLAAVKEKGQIIVGHRLVLHPGPWDDEVASLLAEVIERSPSGSQTGIVVAGDLNGPPLPDLMRAGGPRLLARVLGSHLDTLPLRHQRKRKGEIRLVPGDPVSRTDAELAVQMAIDAHNGRLAT